MSEQEFNNRKEETEERNNEPGHRAIQFTQNTREKTESGGGPAGSWEIIMKKSNILVTGV